MKRTHLSLFSGIGGLDLAAEWAGFETVGHCEWADYPTKVLEKHWPDVPSWRDIRSLTKESFHERAGLRTVDVISGGFPCQPFSVAGKRRGSEDDRYLWPEMLRVIDELRPAWVVGENVENAVRMVAGEIMYSLEKIGYCGQIYIISAYCSGAWFNGKRMVIVAASNNRSTSLRRNIQFSTDEKTCTERDYYRGGTPKFDLRERWLLESRPYGVAHEIPHRVDRLRSLGNAVVPQQFYPIFQAIVEVERKSL